MPTIYASYGPGVWRILWLEVTDGQDKTLVVM